jgi:hypothetical protein
MQRKGKNMKQGLYLMAEDGVPVKKFHILVFNNPG